MKTREILFRGKRIDNGEWAQGYYHQDPEDGHFITSFHYKQTTGSLDEPPEGWFEKFVAQVNPKTVGQYTGLKDKDGKMIFEGDILNRRYFPLNGNPDAVEYYQEEIVMWNFNGWGAKQSFNGIRHIIPERAYSHQKECREKSSHPTVGFGWVKGSFDLEKSTVIGNIHDNRELLNAEAEKRKE